MTEAAYFPTGCQLCGDGTESDIHYPEVGQVCAECALSLLDAQKQLALCGLNQPLTQPKNSNPKTTK